MELKGKRIAFLGDSITEGSGVADLSNRYDNRLKETCGLAAVYNYGIGGTRLAHQSKPSEKPRHDLCFCGRAYNIDPDADAIVVFGGTNDYGHGDAPFGTLSDSTPATYCGAVRFLMKLLRELFPDKPVLFLAPCRRNGDEGVYTLHQANNPHARPLLAYVDVIKTVAKEYDIPVLDLYRTLPINPNTEEDRRFYAPDGLHLNDAGHGLLASLVKEALEQM